jgi:hypothetical protein
VSDTTLSTEPQSSHLGKDSLSSNLRNEPQSTNLDKEPPSSHLVRRSNSTLNYVCFRCSAQYSPTNAKSIHTVPQHCWRFYNEVLNDGCGRVANDQARPCDVGYGQLLSDPPHLHESVDFVRMLTTDVEDAGGIKVCGACHNLIA